MNHHAYFSGLDQYAVCVLVPTIRASEINQEYLKPFGINPNDVLVLSLDQEPGKKKSSVAFMKEYVKSELAPILNDFKIQYVICGDAEYFKILTGNPKAEANLGYVLPAMVGDFYVVYVPNYRSIFYDPLKIRPKIAQGIQALVAHASNAYQPPGNDIITFEEYPDTLVKISDWLHKLLAMGKPLTCDIEAFSLKASTSGIGTIAFAWSQTEGIAFAVDYIEYMVPMDGEYGYKDYNAQVRSLLREFFIECRKRGIKLIFHSIGYDASALIYQLFMDDITDTEGLLLGLDTIMNDWDDTKLITYLATNSCAGNKLSLKEQAQEYAGNYAQDEIADIKKIPLPVLLKYNLVDCLSTWYVRNKWYNKMVADQQEDIYETLFKPAMVDIVQMQLTGMPININRVAEVKILLEIDSDRAISRMKATRTIQQFTYRLNEDWVTKRNLELKVKRVTLADAHEQFNPNSGPQLQKLLFEVLNLPVLSKTDSGQPSTDGDTLKALKHHTIDADVLEFLDALADHKAVDKILTSFIPAMEKATPGKDGWHYLCGNFNLGGTLSGRLSSSDPNLQNLPASSKYAKLIKSCFEAPPGWLFCGLDFNSLEDKISGLTTKDPNKLKVYTDGYDGHSLRAYAYWGDQMPTIVNTVESINSIQDKNGPYAVFRQDSKAPTFALTYQGTYVTLMKNCGFDRQKAMAVEANFKELYKVSIQWVEDQLAEAAKTGYITAAFGLRIRTPLLHQVVRGNSKTPYEATAEGRSAGNALGQSWCLLNNRASKEFMGKVRVSKHRLNIRPCAHIHDAQYMLVRDQIDAILFANEHLVKAVFWQDHPAIEHPQVKLGGEFSIFWPTWQNEVGIPNGATEDEVYAAIHKGMLKWEKAQTKN